MLMHRIQLLKVRLTSLTTECYQGVILELYNRVACTGSEDLTAQ